MTIEHQDATATMTPHPAWQPPRYWRPDPLSSGLGRPPLIALVGASGGVGTSTLAQMWGPAADSGTCWPANTTTTQWCLLVARMSMAGIDDAAARLREDDFPSGVDVFGIVWTLPRPGRIPKDVNRYASTIGELVDHAWTVPWVEELMLARRASIAPWLPSRPLPDKKHSDLAQSPPLALCTTGADIVRVATERYRR